MQTGYRSILILVLSAAVTLLHLEVKAGETPPDPDSRQAAEKGIDILRGLIEDGDPRIFGFKSASEAETLLQDATKALGPPIRIYAVRLTWSKVFEPTADPEDFLIETYRVIYPVITGGQVRTALTLAKASSERQWVLMSFGPADFAKKLMKFRRPESRFAVVTLGVTPLFLGSGSHRQLMLTPITDLPMFGFEAGKPLPALDVFSKLVQSKKSKDVVGGNESPKPQ